MLVFIVNYIIKSFIHRPRPYVALDLPVPTEELALSSIPTDSFPSDHAAVSMTIAATLLFRGYRTKNRGIQKL
ncbi:MAG: phosphatase PAP2 family protein [Candidatus Peribacteria bacterium]|nr:MAG: phosphatase PAP2 family protein [Candidatus Peribacteria bacterium]